MSPARERRLVGMNGTRRLTLLVLLASTAAAPAATHVWQGATSGGHWNSVGNWTNGKPTSGEIGGTILQFGSGISTIDDLSGLIVDEIIFTGGGNSVGGTATIVFGEATSINISNLAGSNSFGTGISFTLPTYLTFVNLPAGTVTINGNVTGTGGGFELVNPTPSGTGTLVLLGTNSWVGSTYVDNGTLSIDASTTNGGMPSDVYIGNGTGAANSAVLTEGSANNISDTANVGLSSDGRWNLAGNETIGRLNGTGGTVSLGSSILTVNPTGVSSFAGVITGTGVFRKLGNYTQVLSGNNTYSGGTDVTAGAFVINGNQPAGAVTVQSGAFLFGSGTVGPLTAFGGAYVSPGSSPPPTPVNAGPGVLSVSGNLTLASGSTYIADVNGTTPA